MILRAKSPFCANSEKETGLRAEENNFELESDGEEEYDGEEMGENSAWCHICDDGGNLLLYGLHT